MISKPLNCSILVVFIIVNYYLSSLSTYSAQSTIEVPISLTTNNSTSNNQSLSHNIDDATPKQPQQSPQVQLVPKNHRMDPEQPEVSQTLNSGNDKSQDQRAPSLEAGNRFFGQQANNNEPPSWWFMGPEQQFPNDKQQQPIILDTNSQHAIAEGPNLVQQPDNQQQWSVAYNQEPSIGRIVLGGNSMSNGNFPLAAPNSTTSVPYFGLINNQPRTHMKLDGAQQVVDEPVSFDDENDNHDTSYRAVVDGNRPHVLDATHNSIDSRESSSEADVAPDAQKLVGVSLLRDAQNALEENLAIQNKLIVLLNRPAKKFPQNNSSLSSPNSQQQHHQQQQQQPNLQARLDDRQQVVFGPTGSAHKFHQHRKPVYKRRLKKFPLLQSVGLPKFGLFATSGGDWSPASSISSISTHSGAQNSLNYASNKQNSTTDPENTKWPAQENSYQPPLSPYTNSKPETPLKAANTNLVSIADNVNGHQKQHDLPPQVPSNTIEKSSRKGAAAAAGLSADWQVSKLMPTGFLGGQRKRIQQPVDAQPAQFGENFYRQQRQVDSATNHLDPSRRVIYQHSPVQEQQQSVTKSGSNDLEYMDLSRKIMIGQGQPLSLYSTFYSDSDETTPPTEDNHQDLQDPSQQAALLTDSSQYHHHRPNKDEQLQLDNTAWPWPGSGSIAQRDLGQRMHLQPGSHPISGRSGGIMGGRRIVQKAGDHQFGAINRYNGLMGGKSSNYYRSSPTTINNNLVRQRHLFYNKPPVLTDSSYYNPIASGSSSSLAKYDDFSGGGGGVSEFRDMRSPSHQVVHIHSKEKKGYGKYIWPIVGGGLTMLMGFLIISNILLSIPLLAIGASTLFNSQQGGSGGGGSGGFHSQQLVPVYNLSQIMPPARPSGSGRRRKKRWTPSSDDGSSSSIQTGKPPSGAGRRRWRVAGDIDGRPQADSELELKLEARLERLIDQIVASSSVSRLLHKAGGLFGWKSGLTRKQVLKAAYCHKPINFNQQLVL